MLWELCANAPTSLFKNAEVGAKPHPLRWLFIIYQQNSMTLATFFFFFAKSITCSLFVPSMTRTSASSTGRARIRLLLPSSAEAASIAALTSGQLLQGSLLIVRHLDIDHQLRPRLQPQLRSPSTRRRLEDRHKLRLAVGSPSPVDAYSRKITSGLLVAQNVALLEHHFEGNIAFTYIGAS